MGARGFDLFHFWYQLYQSAVEDVLPPYDMFTEESKIQFNTQLKLFRGKSGWAREEIPNILVYAVYHDPFKKGVEYYGNINRALATHNKYLSWKNKHGKMIKEHGIQKAILMTAPTLDKKEFEKEVDLDLYLEAFKELDV